MNFAAAPAAAVHVATIGDSTIDNLIWMDKDARGLFKVGDSVVGRLRAALGGGGAAAGVVTNFAADGFTSSNVLHGALPMLSSAAWRKVGEPFPCAVGEALLPLQALADLHRNTKPVTHVLLSVGGNDVREILQNMHALPQVVARFHENYARICERVLALDGVKLVLMLQYQVCLSHEHGGYGVYSAMESLPGPGTGAEKLQAVMERIYGPVIKLAQTHRLAVIDLPRTFDPADAELYRQQIEPSAKGSGLIAAVVAHALATHDFAGESVLYSRANGAFRAEANRFDGPTNPWRIMRSLSGAAGGGGAALAPPAQMAAQLDAAASHAAALPHAVAGLTEMGFPEDKVRAALARCGNLPQQALELLLAPDHGL